MIFIKKNLQALAIALLSICSATDVTARNYHEERLNVLKKNGFQPRVIYDIGAHYGEWTSEVNRVFNQAQFFLFEANEHNRPYLQRAGFPYFISLLGDREDLVTFYAINNTGDSVFREQTSHYKDGCFKEKSLQMTKLSTLVKKNSLPLPDLIKMDVQGAEKLIIQGSPDIVCNAEVVILETKILEYNKNAPLIHEMMNVMSDLGYCVLDILELHYLPTQELVEVDLLFVKNNSPLIKKGILC